MDKRIGKLAATISIIIIILIVVAACAFAIHVKYSLEKECGIKISGGIPVIDYTLRGHGKNLVIRHNGMEISGTALKKLEISCTRGVGELHINNLRQQKHSLKILVVGSTMLTIEGENRLKNITSLGDLTLECRNSATIVIKDRILSAEKLIINNGGIEAGGLVAMEDMRLEGKANVYLKNYGEEWAGDLCSSERQVTINLSESGSFVMENDDLHITAPKGIKLCGTNTIILPEKGKLRKIKDKDGDYYRVYDAAGVQAKQIIIKPLKEK